MPDRDGDNDQRGRFTDHDRLDPERSLEEARRMLGHTRAFLDAIGKGDDAGRRYIEGLKENLENDLRRLEAKPPRSDDGDGPGR